MKRTRWLFEKNFVNLYTIKRKLSRNKSMSAELVGSHDEEAFNCFIVIKDNDGKELLNEHLFSEEPDEFLFNARIGDIRWVDKTTVRYQSKDKKELGLFDIGDVTSD